LKVLKVGAVWGVWKPRFPTPPGLGSVPGRVVWTPSRGGPVWQGPLTKHMYGLGPPKGGGEGGLGGMPSWLSRTSWQDGIGRGS